MQGKASWLPRVLEGHAGAVSATDKGYNPTEPEQEEQRGSSESDQGQLPTRDCQPALQGKGISTVESESEFHE